MLNLKPEIRAMSREQIARVRGHALTILATTGVQVDDPIARKRFDRAGIKVGDDHRARISEARVKAALDTVPGTITVYDRLGRPGFTLRAGADQAAVFGVGVTNLHFKDPVTRKIVPFHRRHMAVATGICHHLESFDFISTPGVIQDLPPGTADLYGVLEMTANTTKPQVMLISDYEGFIPALDLLAHLRGQDLSDRPFVIPYVNPITPLVLNAETTLKMDAAIDRGLPVIFSNYGMSGATCPITPAGTLALLTAELLAGLVYSQLVRSGAPIILGSLPAAFDMKHAGSFYSPATLLLNLACAEVVSSLGVPHCGTSGSVNGWGADLLTATTLCINHFTCCLGKPGMVPFVGGCFDSLVFSPELVVYAHDVITQSRQFAAGFSLADDAVGFSDIEAMGPGGNYLMSGLTGKHFRQSQFSSTIWPFLALDKWQTEGSPSAEKVLNQATCKILETLSGPSDQAEILAKGEAYLSLKNKNC